MTKITPVILCGGGGTRLWPLSDALKPKQFLPLASQVSVLSETLARVSEPDHFETAIAVGAKRHKALLTEALPDAEIILEPVGRNSAPPIAAACLSRSPDSLLLILPADHYIADVASFLRAIQTGVPAAESGAIVTFGIQPDYPATGYGYIESEGEGAVRPVLRFVEKPDAETAQSYLETGRFFWNAGIFLFRVQTMLEAFKLHAPDILKDVQASLTSDGRLERARFENVRSESIDYAVLEAADNISVVPVSMGWSDLGDFRSLHETVSTADSDGNVRKGQTALTESTNSFVYGDGVRVAVHGVDDLAVVATPENVLVTRLSDSARIKTVYAYTADPAFHSTTLDQRDWLNDWLWNHVLPGWAERSIDPVSGGFVECLDLEGHACPGVVRRGRVAARQVFSFARAKRLGWNPEGAADSVINTGLDYLLNGDRPVEGGWGHSFAPDGRMVDSRRDLYDHAFVALAGAELAALGDFRGEALASEAFELIDDLFFDPAQTSWWDPETAPTTRLANPHMHLLEASLLHYETLHDEASLQRIEDICVLFERWMFDPRSGAVIEVFQSDWSRLPEEDERIEPGHCYEWAFLLSEAQRLTGRDTASWRRRLIGYAEQHGLQNGLVVACIGDEAISHRLWPQLERYRALQSTPTSGVDLSELLDNIMTLYLRPGPDHGWIDRLDEKRQPDVSTVPASMLYHLMSSIAPLVPYKG